MISRISGTRFSIEEAMFTLNQTKEMIMIKRMKLPELSMVTHSSLRTPNNHLMKIPNFKMRRPTKMAHMTGLQRMSTYRVEMQFPDSRNQLL